MKHETYGYTYDGSKRIIYTQSHLWSIKKHNETGEESLTSFGLLVYTLILLAAVIFVIWVITHLGIQSSGRDAGDNWY